MLLMLAVSLLGAVMSSTGVVAIFIPVVLLVAERQKFSPGRLMMPLSFAGLIGGMLTLVGTAPNLVADSCAATRGLRRLRLFRFHAIRCRHPRGGHRLHAHGPPLAESRRRIRSARVSTRRRLMDFVRDYKLAAASIASALREDSPLVVGQTLVQLGARAARRGEHRRHRAHGPGAQRDLLEPRADMPLRAGDVLLIDFPEPD